MKKLLFALLIASRGYATTTTVEVGFNDIGTSVAGGTTGSVLFVGAGPVLAQNNSGLFWNNSTLRFGVLTATPAGAIGVAQDSASVPALALGNATDGGPLLTLADHSGHLITVDVPTAVTPYTLTLPTSTGAGFLQNNGGGSLSWTAAVTAGSLANTLAGLGSTQIATVASTVNLASTSGLPTIDGIDLSAIGGGLVFLKNQTDNTTNGLWDVDAFGVWTRNASMPDGSCDGRIVTINQGGTVNAGTTWLTSCNGSNITVTEILKTALLDATKAPTFNVSGAIVITETGGHSGNVPHAQSLETSTTNTSATCAKTCAAGEVLTGGGCSNSGTDLLISSYPSSTTAWSCKYGTAVGNCTATAMCYQY